MGYLETHLIFSLSGAITWQETWQCFISVSETLNCVSQANGLIVQVFCLKLY